MSYFNSEKIELNFRNMSMGIEKAMSLIDKSHGLIDAWTLDSCGNIELIQRLQCGCKNTVGTIILEIPMEEIDVLSEGEFIMQLEEMLLEVSNSMGHDNLLFFLDDVEDISSECKECKNMYI